ncbi:MAG: GNAT family protein [Atribacterota bacterium]|nr:GNAT family protein [Atribacterota bacterium]
MNQVIIKRIKQKLEQLPGVSIKSIKIDNKIINQVVIKKELIGQFKISQLETRDYLRLFKFYFKGLSKKSRFFFPPYPLFSPVPRSAGDLKKRIKEWRKEKDWTFLNIKIKKDIIGVCLLKRFKTKRPVSGLAISEKFQKKGLGTVLQTIINEQVKLLSLKKLYVTIAEDNIASQMVHKNCGFKKTGKQVPHFNYKNGKKIIDRYDIEMVKKIN